MVISNMKKIFMTAFAALLFQTVSAQTLEKMNWYNEPENWEI